MTERLLGGRPAGRPPVESSGGMVASSHREVSAVGASVLRDGGTAVDAALAMAAMSFLCLPGQCGVGGDTFAVWFDASTGAYHSIQGSGVGPDGADVAFYRRQGMSAVPLDGPLSVAVPGAVAALDTLHRNFATRPLRDLWAPAIAAARNGLPMSAKTRSDIVANADKLSRDPNTLKVFLPGGQPPSLGETFRQSDLATTLERIADAPRDFYVGDLADACLDALVGAGAPFSRREWAATTAEITPTVAGRYRGHAVHQCRPPSPGYMLLQQAAVLEPFLPTVPWLSATAVNWFARAAMKAFAARLAIVGSDTEAWRKLLSADHIAEARQAIAKAKFAPSGGTVTAGDTTSFVVVDSHGNAMSYIHSLAFTFGAGVMVPGTGIVLNDRLGRGAYLDEQHPNGLRPHRKPMHTLNAWIAADDLGRPAYVGNTPGGDGQVQWNMQLLSHLLDHGLDPQQAVDAPRFSAYPGSDADSLGARPKLRVESRLDEGVAEALRALGHDVVAQGPWEGGGSAQVIAVHAERCLLVGGSDSRFDGAAVGV